MERAAVIFMLVARVHAQLTNETMVLGHDSHWAMDSHLLHGALSAIAECATWFPALVKTTRRWRRVLGSDRDLAARSCAYA